MSVVLALGGVPRLARLTGLAAGTLIFCYILFEAPISGFSLNPARSFASALPAGVWIAFWILASPGLRRQSGRSVATTPETCSASILDPDGHVVVLEQVVPAPSSSASGQ